jgi:capsular exopolysaccharide synthesis family protein
MGQPSPYFIRRSQPIDGEPIETSFRGTIPEQDERTFDLLNYWITLRKHRWLVAVVTIALGSIVAIYVSTVTPLYRSEAVVLVKPSTPMVMTEHTGQSESSQVGGDWDSIESFLTTQVEILKSRALATTVVSSEDLMSDPVFSGAPAKPGLFDKLASNLAAALGFNTRRAHATVQAPPSVSRIDGVIGSYLGMFEIKRVSETDLVKIIFTTSNPRLSARLANAHAHAYIREGVELRTQANAEAERFLREKLVELKEKLEHSELALNNYRRDKGIVPGLMSVDGKENIVIDRLSNLSKEMTSAQVGRIGLQAQVDQIKNHHVPDLSGLIATATGTASGTSSSVSGQLAQAQSDYAAMARQFKPQYPPLQQLKARLDQLQSSYAGNVTAAYEAALAKEADLQHEIDRERVVALSVNDAAVEYAILAREVDTNRDLYNSVLQRMKDVGLAAESQSSNTVVVDGGQVPSGPSSPHRMMATMQGMAVGLMLGVGLAFLLEYQDKTLKTPEQVETTLHLPNLATVPAFAMRGDARNYPYYKYREMLGYRFGSNGAQVPSLAEERRELAGSLSRFSVVGEAYRALRTALMLSRAGAPPKTILFTSATNSEGKTVSSTNSAVVFAQTGARVALVDCDLRRPRCHKVLGMDNFTGLTEVLAGARKLRDTIRPTNIEGLSFLGCGSIPPNPSELVGSDKMRETLAQLISEYDLVVIDSPPILPVTDAMLLSTMVDGVVLVVNSSRTPKHLVKAARARLEFARAKVFGVLLNEVDTASHHYQYYARYYGSPGDYNTYHHEPDKTEGTDDDGLEDPDHAKSV